MKTPTQSRIVKSINQDVVNRTAARCRKRGVRIPTFRQMAHPEEIPSTITERLGGIGLWDVNPLNLFRITWKNDVSTGLFGGVNYLEIPSAISGVSARIIGLTGK